MKIETSRAAGTRRSSPGIGTAFFATAGVFTAICLLAAMAFLLWPTNGSVSASFLRAQPGSIPWNGRDPMRMLVMATVEHSGRPATTDAMMVISVEPAFKSVHILSVPANLWLTVPGFGQASVSDALSDGGPRLSLLTVQSALAVPVPYYAVFDAGTFAQLVDDVGGAVLPGKSTRSPRVTLNGADAWRYATQNNRGTNSAVDLLARQQELFLSTVRQALQPQTIFQIPSITTTLGGSISTNFPFDRVDTLVQTLLHVPAQRYFTDSLRRENGTVANYGATNDAVLMPDWQHIRALARQFFSADAGLFRSPVQVLNGTGVPGQAQALAVLLQQARLRVSSFDSAPSFTYARTHILVPHGASPEQLGTAQAISALLQIPVTNAPRAVKAARVVVIIGRDFQDPSQQ